GLGRPRSDQRDLGIGRILSSRRRCPPASGGFVQESQAVTVATFSASCCRTGMLACRSYRATSKWNGDAWPRPQVPNHSNSIERETFHIPPNKNHTKSAPR